MTTRIAASASFLFCAVLSATASANPGQNFSWSFQTTSLSASSAYQIAAAMRNGEAWPVVITDTSSTYGAAATLFPAATSAGSPSPTWQNIGTNFFPSVSSINRLRAATSPDGRVAFAASSFSSPYAGLGGRVSSVTGGWGALPADTKAVAFDSHGNLYTATATSVSGVGGFSSAAPIVDMAVSPTGEIGVVTADNKFWQYSNWTGSWAFASLPGPSPIPEAMDLAYDSLGRPHVAVTVSNTIVAYDFSTVTGQWSASTLAANLGSSSTRVTLAANDDGTVGTSWIDSSGSLVYAYKHDLDNWASASVTNLGGYLSSPSQVGIAYDYAGLPVLAYRPYSGSYVMLAYDPVVVPEPASLTLLGLAAAATLARRRTRRA